MPDGGTTTPGIVRDPRLLEMVRRAVRYAMRRRGVSLTAEDVEDVTQTVLVRFLERDIARIDATMGDGFGLLLKRAAWTVGEAVRLRARGLELRRRLSASVRDEVQGPDDVLARRLRERYAAALPTLLDAAGLPPDEASAVRGCVERRPLREVAARAGKHPSTVSRARKRGLARLAATLPALPG